MDRELFRERLIERRKEKGYTTQKSFADAYNKRFNSNGEIDGGTTSGILGTLKNYEAAGKKCNPRLEIVSNMCVLLDCSVDYLLGNIDECTHEAAIACAYTGLSGEAIELLKERRKEKPEEITVLDRLICSFEYSDILKDIYSYIRLFNHTPSDKERAILKEREKAEYREILTFLEKEENRSVFTDAVMEAKLNLKYLDFKDYFFQKIQNDFAFELRNIAKTSK